MWVERERERERWRKLTSEDGMDAAWDEANGFEGSVERWE